jgi:SAM-dependent methyltransferase
MGEVALKQAEPATKALAPEPLEQLRKDLTAAIRAALSVRYTSYSSKDNLKTGNAYQSVRLGEDVREGFRTLRRSVLAGLPIKDARVLDLGCNLGELSRLARDCGAALVDGFEYDPYFVQTGRAINALNGVTRVSFYERDITKPEIYTEPYDIVLCFSVFTYAKLVLPQLERNCRKFFLLETHKIDRNWQREYIDSVTKHFPYYAIVQRTDWGSGMDGARLIIAFARTMDEINEFVTQRYTELGPVGEQLRHLDVARSRPSVLARIREWLDDQSYASIDDLREPARKALADYGDYIASPEFKAAASGLVYWLAYLNGYFHYRDKGGVADDNPYLAYLRVACPKLNFDPYLTKVVHDTAAISERLRMRFRDVDAADDAPTQPILVFNPMPNTGAMRSTLVDSETGAELMFSHQDGYHRHFAAVVRRRPRLPYRVAWQPQHPGFTRFLERSPGLQDELFESVRVGLG